jgi:dihydroorotate dehydrogenase (NAD+) catalytic subunit
VAGVTVSVAHGSLGGSGGASLRVTLGRLELETPLIGASGTFGYGLEYGGLVDWRAYGAVVAKTVTLRPRDGNPPPRLADLGDGILNSIGLENVGCEAFIREKLPKIKLPCKLVASIAGESVDEYRQAARLVGAEHRIAAIEINVSCPNVARGGQAIGRDPDATREVVAAVKAETGLPVFPKLPPVLAGIERIAEAASAGGADALVVANTYPGMSIDIDRERPLVGNVSGGVSGRAIRPLTVLLVWKVAGAVGVPVVASGGIELAEDAIEYILAGASAFEIGSVVLRELDAASRIVAGIRAFMERKGYSRIDDFRGRALRRDQGDVREPVGPTQ